MLLDKVINFWASAGHWHRVHPLLPVMGGGGGSVRETGSVEYSRVWQTLLVAHTHTASVTASILTSFLITGLCIVGGSRPS